MNTPFNFLGIPEIDPKEAQVIVMPVPFEKTTSYGHGTKFGPEAIIKASRELEWYDEEIGRDLQEIVRISTIKPVKGNLEAITKAATRNADKFLVSLGGEHSITPALLKPFAVRYPDLSVLQIDAHTDMREEWDGSKNSHACAMRRVKDQGISNIVQVGIRNTAKDEPPQLNQDNIFRGDRFELDKVMEKLGREVYLTFDVDGLDISIMPATGTPEPGGLSYGQALELIKAVAQRKHLVGADFVELAPIKKMPAYDFLVAKLVYKLIRYKFA
jgi:agmatinase